MRFLATRLEENKKSFKPTSSDVQVIYDYRYYQVRLLVTRMHIELGAGSEHAYRHSNIIPATETFRVIQSIRSDSRLKKFHFYHTLDYWFALLAIQ